MKRKGIGEESPSLTREEECYEELQELLMQPMQRSDDSPPSSVLTEPPPSPLEYARSVARECPGAFRLEDRNGLTLLHHACYSEHVTVELLHIFHDLGTAFEQADIATVDGRRSITEHMTFNTEAPHDAFLFLMDKAKPMRDPYDFYLELRFLCQNTKYPVHASQLRRVVEACPNAMSMTFGPDRGRDRPETLLHLLCSNETATLEAIAYLNEVYPDAIPIQSSFYGCPLHAACFHGLSKETIFFLTEQHQEALGVIGYYGTPLHTYLMSGLHKMQSDYTRGERQTDTTSAWERSGLDIDVVRHFISIYPQALQVIWNQESSYCKGTPLHIMIKMLHHDSENSDVISVIQEMARISPAALQAQSNTTHPLLHVLCSRLSYPHIALVESLIDSDPSLLSLPTAVERLLPIHVLCNNWSKSTPIESLKCILNQAPHTVMEPTADGHLPIHFLFSEYGDIPFDAIQLLVECNADMLRVPLDNGLGLPIHFACRKYNTNAETVRYLVSKYPESTKVRTIDGLSPLDCAITSRTEEDVIDFLLEKDPYVAMETISPGKGTSFHIACKHGSLETIKKIYEICPRLIQQPNENKDLPLLSAISECRDGAVILFLLNEFPNSTATTNSDGMLPLHAACGAEDPDSWLVEVLIKYYPYAMHMPTKDGRYPIQILCNNPSLTFRGQDTLRFLARQLPYSLSRCDDEGRNPLHLFCQHRWSEIYSGSLMAKETIQKLHELNPDAIREESEEFGLPIHCACKAGCGLEVLKQLIELYPESINIRHKTLGLPLHCSIENTAVFEFLLEKRYGSYIEKRGNFLLHALLEDEAIDRKEDLANALFALTERNERNEWYRHRSSFHRKKPHLAELKDHRGRLPLHLAVSVGLEVEFVRELIGIYPDAVGERDREGNVPLHCAFRNGAQPVVVDLLVERNPKTMEIADKNNRLPFHLGCQYHHRYNFMDHLIHDFQYWYDINVDVNLLCQKRDNDGDLPLHKACLGGNLDCISSLASVYPLALQTRNYSGMFPVFLLCQGEGKDDLEAKEEKYVGAIFDLLTQYPESVYHFA